MDYTLPVDQRTNSLKFIYSLPLQGKQVESNKGHTPQRRATFSDLNSTVYQLFIERTTTSCKNIIFLFVGYRPPMEQLFSRLYRTTSVLTLDTNLQL